MNSITIRSMLLICALSGFSASNAASAQAVYWQKDYITDDAGRVVATATPVPFDQIAPAAPAGLSHAVLSQTSARLQWSPSTDSGGSGLAGYKIYRGDIVVAAVATTAFTDEDLRPLTTYTYSVVAFDTAGNHSARSNAVTFATVVPPAVPTALTASAVSGTQINLSWTDNSNDEIGFSVERMVAGRWAPLASVASNVTGYSSTDLNGSTTYYYRVRAFGAGGASAPSNEASATTPLQQPTSVVVYPSIIGVGECYTIMVGSGANITLDVQYSLNGGWPQEVENWQVLNAKGQARVCTDAQTAIGTYYITAVRNTLSTDWVQVSAPITVTPPQPTSLTITPGSVNQGQCYLLAAGNAAYVTIDIRYTLNGGFPQEIDGWPALSANGDSYICTDAATVPGTYRIVSARNTLNTAWVDVSAPITVIQQ